MNGNTVQPSARQLSWHQIGFYALIHFSINTFTDKEWGYGDEPASTFNPTEFYAAQIVNTCCEAGMKALILVCKHHDGFCLWPTQTTEHCIRNSPWKNGKGDMVREFADACRAVGLKFGVYLSPWDRNHPTYGTTEYIDVYRKQLEELLTGYGPITAEVWFDGANGGDGYYGGACEYREIDRTVYYDWENTWAMVRRLQPEACMFSDVGPDIRWVGNENGIARENCWATYTPHSPEGDQPPAPGFTAYLESMSGHADGKYWMPPECDVPLRPGWFYHAHEDDQVKTPEELWQIYQASCGNGGGFCLGLAPDRRGLMHQNDIKALREFGTFLRTAFAKNIFTGTLPKMNESREMVFDLPAGSGFNLIDLREDIRNGHRIRRFAIDLYQEGRWQETYSGECIGARRIFHSVEQQADKIRLRVIEANDVPVITFCGVYKVPTLKSARQGQEIRHDRTSWKIVTATGGNATNLINGDPGIDWESILPGEVVIDMKEMLTVKGFTMRPGTNASLPDHYDFHVSPDGAEWGESLSCGEFANIQANPIEQRVMSSAKNGRFIRLRITGTVDNPKTTRLTGEEVTFAITDFNIIT